MLPRPCVFLVARALFQVSVFLLCVVALYVLFDRMTTLVLLDMSTSRHHRLCAFMYAITNTCWGIHSQKLDLISSSKAVGSNHMRVQSVAPCGLTSTTTTMTERACSHRRSQSRSASCKTPKTHRRESYRYHAEEKHNEATGMSEYTAHDSRLSSCSAGF